MSTRGRAPTGRRAAGGWPPGRPSPASGRPSAPRPGRSSRAGATAAAPSAASPTTSESGWAASSAPKPCRTIAWSSAISTLIICGSASARYGSTATTGNRRLVRTGRRACRRAAWRARASRSARARPGRRRPVPALGGPLLDGHPDQPVRTPRPTTRHRAAGRVPGRVGQGFLHDPVRGQPDRLRHASASAGVDVRASRPRPARRAVATSAPQRRPGPAAARVGALVVLGAQHPEQPPHVGQRRPGRRRDGGQLGPGRRAAARPAGTARSPPAPRSSTCGGRPRRASPGRSGRVPPAPPGGPAPARSARSARPAARRLRRRRDTHVAEQPRSPPAAPRRPSALAGRAKRKTGTRLSAVAQAGHARTPA